MAAQQPWSRTNKIRAVSLLGFAAYVVSYFLPAAHHAGTSDFSGLEAALLTFNVVLHTPGTNDSIGYGAALISGWINPLFLFAFALLLRNPDSRVGAALRGVVVVMFPACWVLFYVDQIEPEVGYFVWTAAMLLALFAGKLLPAPADGRIAPRSPAH